MLKWIKNLKFLWRRKMDNSKIKQDSDIDNNTNSVENFLDSEYCSYKKINSNKFLELNEKDYIKKLYSNSLCNYCECHEKAINSHTYPHAFLKKFSNNEELQSICIDKIAIERYAAEYTYFIDKSFPKQAGVAPLFCNSHDTTVFKRIENSSDDVDLDTYLYLFLYRAFIYDYTIEGMIKSPSSEREINQKGSYSKKINKEIEGKYLTENYITKKILDISYNYDIYQDVKFKFDKIFTECDRPEKKDFEEYFKIYYYKLKSMPKFLGTGSMYIQYDESKHLPSIYGIVPDKKGKNYYYAILVPNSEVKTMEKLIELTQTEYEKYDKGQDNSFLTIVLFQILDSSQNMIFNNESIRLMDEKEIVFLDKMYHHLTLSRSLFCKLKMCDIRNYVYKQISKNKDLINKIF